MTIRRFAIVVNAAAFITNAGAALIVWGWSSLFYAALSALNVALFVYNVRRYRKESRGRNRPAETGSQDSSSGTITHNITISGDSSGFAEAFRASAQSLAQYNYWLAPNAQRAKEAPAPEVVEGDMPILAHRSARLLFPADSRMFGSVTGRGTFGIDAEAVCRGDEFLTPWGPSGHGSRHTAPALGCRCGFYALPVDKDATYLGHSYVTLMVELSGTVIEHELGYRAQHQRVIECQLPPCAYCGAQADVLVVAEHEMTEATCLAHRPVPKPGEVTMTLADIVQRLPIPVTRLGCERRELA